MTCHGCKVVSKQEVWQRAGKKRNMQSILFLGRLSGIKKSHRGGKKQDAKQRRCRVKSYRDDGLTFPPISLSCSLYVSLRAGWQAFHTTHLLYLMGLARQLPPDCPGDLTDGIQANANVNITLLISITSKVKRAVCESCIWKLRAVSSTSWCRSFLSGEAAGTPNNGLKGQCVGFSAN